MATYLHYLIFPIVYNIDYVEKQIDNIGEGFNAAYHVIYLKILQNPVHKYLWKTKLYELSYNTVTFKITETLQHSCINNLDENSHQIKCSLLSSMVFNYNFVFI